MNVMKKAWKIAREAVEKFGGKVKEYFAASLKLAWQMAKQAKKSYVELIQDTYLSLGYREVLVSFKNWGVNNFRRLYINVTDNKGKPLNTLYINLVNKMVTADGRNATFKAKGEQVAKIVEEYKHVILATYVK